MPKTIKNKVSAAGQKPLVCLGIDPGLTRIGYGLVIKENGCLRRLASGLLAVPEPPHADQLALIEREVDKLIKKSRPNLIALEKLFFTVNKKTGLAVAQARGVIIAAAIRNKVRIVEMAPSQIKKAITGSGAANKKDIAKMLNFFLPLPTTKMIDDEVDALAAAAAVIHSAATLDF